MLSYGVPQGSHRTYIFFSVKYDVCLVHNVCVSGKTASGQNMYFKIRSILILLSHVS